MNTAKKIQKNREWKWILAGILGIVAFYLITEHRAHILGNLEYILLGAFILMHFFMHGSHGGHGSHHNHESAEENKDNKTL